MSDWNPELYLKFQENRNKPCIDLLRHIDHLTLAISSISVVAPEIRQRF